MAVLATCLLLATIGVACGDDDDEDGGATPVASATPAAVSSPGTDGTVIEVLLVEFSVVPDKSTVPAGEITFRATNEGPDDAHEMVIIRTDLAPDALPTADDGSVPEDDIDLVDEIEEIAVGDSDELTLELSAGSYVLICNIVQEEPDGTIESHYQKGMRSALTVE
jgi:uncharacterized cupredoxin-like copper-binding protein